LHKVNGASRAGSHAGLGR